LSYKEAKLSSRAKDNPKQERKSRHKLYEIASVIADYSWKKIGKKVLFRFEVSPNWLNTTLEKAALGFLWRPTCLAYKTISGKPLEQVIDEYGPVVLLNNSHDIYFDFPLNLYIEFDEQQHFNQFRASTLEHYPALGPKGKWRFDLDEYVQYCKKYIAKPGLSGFQKLKSRDPLFLPMGNGVMQDNRHRQRAFRDMLKDYLGILNSNGVLRIPFNIVSKRTANFSKTDLGKIINYIEKKKLMNDLVE